MGHIHFAGRRGSPRARNGRFVSRGGARDAPLDARWNLTAGLSAGENASDQAPRQGPRPSASSPAFNRAPRARRRSARRDPVRAGRRIFKAGCCTYAWHSLCYARITSAIPVGGRNWSRPGETASNTFRSVDRGVSKGIRKGYRFVRRVEMNE